MRSELAAACAHAEKISRIIFYGFEQSFDLRLIGSLQPDARHLKKILADYSSEHELRPRSVLMLIGPEGDFTPAELSLARRHGCQPITLGPIILRVETACNLLPEHSLLRITDLIAVDDGFLDRRSVSPKRKAAMRWRIDLSRTGISTRAACAARFLAD
mgnify:CR=1 FL=1